MATRTGTLVTMIDVTVQPIVQDVEIGAIEVKDHTSDDRAAVLTTGGAKRLAVDSYPTAASVQFTGTVHKTVTVVSAGTPVQGPNVSLPVGSTLLVELRITQAGSPKGYVSESEANVQVASTRKEMFKGGRLAYAVDNMNRLWFDTDIDGAVFEVSAEQ